MAKVNKKTNNEVGMDVFSLMSEQMMEEFLQQEFGLDTSKMSHNDMIDRIYNKGDRDTLISFSILLTKQLAIAVYHPEEISVK